MQIVRSLTRLLLLGVVFVLLGCSSDHSGRNSSAPADVKAKRGNGLTNGPNVPQLAGVWVYDRPLEPNEGVTSLRLKRSSPSPPRSSLEHMSAELAKDFEDSLRGLSLEFTQVDLPSDSGARLSWRLKVSYIEQAGAAKKAPLEGPVAIVSNVSPDRLVEQQKRTQIAHGESSTAKPLPRDTLYLIAKLPPLFGDEETVVSGTKSIHYHPFWLSSDGQQLLIDSVSLRDSDGLQPTLLLNDRNIHGVFRKVATSPDHTGAASLR